LRRHLQRALERPALALASLVQAILHALLGAQHQDPAAIEVNGAAARQDIFLALVLLLLGTGQQPLDPGTVVRLAGVDDDPVRLRLLEVGQDERHPLEVLQAQAGLLLGQLEGLPGFLRDAAQLVRHFLAKRRVDRVGHAHRDEQLSVARDQVEIAGNAAAQPQPQADGATNQQQPRRHRHPDPLFRLLCAPTAPTRAVVRIVQVILVVVGAPVADTPNRLLGPEGAGPPGLRHLRSDAANRDGQDGRAARAARVAARKLGPGLTNLTTTAVEPNEFRRGGALRGQFARAAGDGLDLAAGGALDTLARIFLACGQLLSAGTGKLNAHEYFSLSQKRKVSGIDNSG